MFAPRATGLPLSLPSLRLRPTTIWSCNLVWSASARLRSSSWDPLSLCTSLRMTAPRTRFSYPGATTPPVTLRLQLTTSRTFTAGARVRSSRSRAFGRVSRLLRSNQAIVSEVLGDNTHNITLDLVLGLWAFKRALRDRKEQNRRIPNRGQSDNQELSHNCHVSGPCG